MTLGTAHGDDALAQPEQRRVDHQQRAGGRLARDQRRRRASRASSSSAARRAWSASNTGQLPPEPGVVQHGGDGRDEHGGHVHEHDRRPAVYAARVNATRVDHHDQHRLHRVRQRVSYDLAQRRHGGHRDVVPVERDHARDPRLARSASTRSRRARPASATRSANTGPIRGRQRQRRRRLDRATSAVNIYRITVPINMPVFVNLSGVHAERHGDGHAGRLRRSIPEPATLGLVAIGRRRPRDPRSAAPEPLAPRPRSCQSRPLLACRRGGASSFAYDPRAMTDPRRRAAARRELAPAGAARRLPAAPHRRASSGTTTST